MMLKDVVMGLSSCEMLASVGWGVEEAVVVTVSADGVIGVTGRLCCRYQRKTAEAEVEG